MHVLARSSQVLIDADAALHLARPLAAAGVLWNKKGGPMPPFLQRIETVYLRSAALASRAARNSESWLQFGHFFELARSLPSV